MDTDDAHREALGCDRSTFSRALERAAYGVALRARAERLEAEACLWAIRAQQHIRWGMDARADLAAMEVRLERAAHYRRKADGIQGGAGRGRA